MKRRRKVNYRSVKASKRTKKDNKLILISLILATLTLLVFTIVGFSVTIYNVNTEPNKEDVKNMKIELYEPLSKNTSKEVSVKYMADTSLNNSVNKEVIKTIETTKIVYGKEVKSTMEEDLEFIPYHTNLKDTYENNLYWLSHIIYAESGSSYCTDELQLLVGSVVLNRVNNPNFPDSIYNVIHDPGQYQPTWNGAINKEPDERAINNAKYLLDNGPIESNIIFQAEFSQGTNTYKVIDICINGNKVSEMHFCY